MEQLRVHVERIVRPVRAAVGRKNKMREELLGHLTQKADALMAAGAGESAACTEAIEQLGNPAGLRADLQTTVPLWERVAYWSMPDFGFFDRFMEKAEGETAFHFALVRAAFIAVVMGAIVVVMMSLRWLGLPPFRQRPVTQSGYCIMMVSITVVWTVIANFITYYVADVTGVRRVLSKAGPSPAWFKGGTLCLFLCASLLAMLGPVVLFAWIINPADGVILWSVFSEVFGRRFGFGILAGLFALFIVASFAMKFEHKQWLRWGSLRIDD